MLLNQLQQRFTQLYETPTDYDIYDFLITDPIQANALSPTGVCDNDERLLISQSDQNLDISVFVDQKTLAQLKDDDPLVGLHEDNIHAFMLALEGVSHFQYLCWNASYDKSVTLLELELQAEVDKYVTVVSVLNDQGRAADTRSIHAKLFSDVSYHDDLKDVVRERYHRANHYAGKYCRALSRNFPRCASHSRFLNELRRFYRLTQNEKIMRITNRH